MRVGNVGMYVVATKERGRRTSEAPSKALEGLGRTNPGLAEPLQGYSESIVLNPEPVIVHI